MTYAAAHNGGTGQVNFGYLNTSGDFPFLNHMKVASTWVLADNSNHPSPLTLNTDGYPTSVSAGGIYCSFLIPPSAARSGRYLLKWDGNGTVGIGMSATYVGASAGVTAGGFNNSEYTSSTGSGRVILDDVAEGCVIKIISVGSPIITNMRFVHEDDEALLDAGDVFGVKFKETILEGNIGAIRFLNWVDTNLTVASTWASVKPETYYSYNADEMRGSIYNVTAGTSTAYTMTAPSGWAGLVDKAQVIAKFHTNGTGAATLSVGGTTAKAILNWAGSALSAGDPDSLPVSGRHAHLMYDAALDSWVKIGGDGAHGQFLLHNGVPPTLLFRLCAEVGAHPYFCIPHYALTPMTDYTSSLAAYCAANAPAWMVPFYEPSNEVWNTGFGFNQTYYAGKVAVAYGWDTIFSETGFNNWYGRALSTVGQDVAAAYSVVKANVKTQTQYRVVGGVQTGGSLAVSGAQAARFESTLYLAQTPQSGYAADAAKDWSTHIAPANYFTPGIYNRPATATEISMAAAYAGIRATVSITGTTLTIDDFGGSPAILGTMQAGIFLKGVGYAGASIIEGTQVLSGSGDTWTLDKNYTTPVTSVGVYGGLDESIPDQYADYLASAGSFTISGLQSIYANTKTFALAHSMTKACGYEGGYSPDLYAPDGDEVNALRSASSYSDKVAKYKVQDTVNFYALTDGSFTAEFASNYLMSGSVFADPTNGVIKYGSVWAVLQDIYQDPRPPQWTAMVLMNNGEAASLVVNN